MKIAVDDLKATIVVCPIGVLGLSEDGKIIDGELFQKDALKIAKKLFEVESGKTINEIATLIRKLKEKGYDAFVLENSEVAQTVREELNVNVEVKTPSEISKTLLEDLEKIAIETGFLKEPKDIVKLIHDTAMELSRIKVRKATEKRDLLIAQAIQAVDDLDKTLNLFMNRIREWYGLHFPELGRLIDNHETYARLLHNLGKRENFTLENLEKEDLPRSKALQVVEAARTSMGADLYNSDMEKIQTMCEHILNLYKARSDLENYIDELMEEVAPNTRALTGASLGARLIAIAGGLNNLAKMPASTIQVLGAEKALFRSLTTGARPPKHGLIFQHALVHGAKRWQRGKIARALAGKLAIAIRTDAFSGNYIGDKLKDELQKRVEEINKKYVEPKLSEKKPKKMMKPSGEARKGKRRKGHGRRS